MNSGSNDCCRRVTIEADKGLNPPYRRSHFISNPAIMQRSNNSKSIVRTRLESWDINFFKRKK